MIIALQCNEADNVAVVFSEEAKAGSTVTVKDKAGRSSEMTLRTDIPFGHKFALRMIKAGEHVLKYGESLGVASADISAGEHVHVHNLESERGRGDLAGRS